MFHNRIFHPARCLAVAILPALLFSTAARAVELAGEWIQGGMILGTASPDARIEFGDKTVVVSPQGHFVIALGRDAPAKATLSITHNGETETRTYPVKSREYDIQYIEGVPQETVTPPREVLARIRREAAQVAGARSIIDARLDYLGGFSAPLEGPITGVYGSQRVYNGTPRNPHFGLDIAAPEGATVTAPAPGVVRLTHPDMYFSGGTLVVDHGLGVTSSFIHLSEILVKEGQRVERGDRIARVGATGRATGPHLDWRINWLDVRVDPAIVLEQFPVTP